MALGYNKLWPASGHIKSVAGTESQPNIDCWPRGPAKVCRPRNEVAAYRKWSNGSGIVVVKGHVIGYFKKCKWTKIFALFLFTFSIHLTALLFKICTRLEYFMSIESKIRKSLLIFQNQKTKVQGKFDNKRYVFLFVKQYIMSN